MKWSFNIKKIIFLHIFLLLFIPPLQAQKTPFPLKMNQKNSLAFGGTVRHVKGLVFADVGPVSRVVVMQPSVWLANLLYKGEPVPASRQCSIYFDGIPTPGTTVSIPWFREGDYCNPFLSHIFVLTWGEEGQSAGSIFMCDYNETGVCSSIKSGSGVVYGTGGTLTLNMKTYRPGDQIKITFTASANFHKSAWIGVVPSNIPHGSESVNDKNDLSYVHIDGKTSGLLKLSAPSNPGNYDIRMNDDDNGGKEVASFSFMVKGHNKPSLYLDKTYFRTGEKITIRFSAPVSYKKSAWIGIIESTVPHGNESTNDRNDIQFQHIDGQGSGTMVFIAPKPGQYDFRMNDDDSNGREVASITFFVNR